ncbi:hypothetical protein CQ052_12985 [Ochrobactrum sp. MYb15]|nr:hypothetical protein CQZ90_06110 [Ochrobactrum sp. MYb19]PRA55153.1 hypothetical protein CQ062_09650 [Ochrobactrum sp. MYb68]PRA68228.1 hypothetical protein CQ053_01100 [Ochrobactrum sp. MYb18]PRA74545.1 hypothetical protein CQ049_14980 [Brucella thiophenivorans]PRA90478.1 hypothetical protein CQ051_11005 [Ochrobactrum sp. MYb14]PRA95929.1 hypothetical protein CQ052_12985 [Ochrobactrum sp. MYb15]
MQTIRDLRPVFLPRIVELVRPLRRCSRLRHLIRLLLLVAVRILRCQVDIGPNVEAFILLRAGEILLGQRTRIEGKITALRNDLARAKIWVAINLFNLFFQ